MKVLKMYKYLYISILLLLFGSSCAKAQLDRMQNMTNNLQSNAQKVDDEEENKEPQILVIKDQGLSVGIDLSPFIVRLINDERTGLAFVGRYGFNYRWYANAELGYENAKYSNDNYEYTSNGTFIRVGIDYDIFNMVDFPTNDNIFVGLRYCYAWQNHKSDHFNIVDSYWGDYSGSINNTSVNSHSIDALFGLRCEMLPNFYMGWSFRCRFLLASAHDNILDPYAIAGYGQYDNKVCMGFTYTIEYQLPLNKKKKR